MDKLLKLQQKRAEAVAAMRAILNAAETRGDGLTDEEKANYDKAFADQEKIREQIETEQRQIQAEREIASVAATVPPVPGAAAGAVATATDPGVAAIRATATPEYRSAFVGWLQGKKTFNEVRALQADVDSAGGYLVLPQETVNMLLKFMDNNLILASLVTFFDIPQAASLGVPELTSDPADSDWTSELATGNEDASMAFGKRELKPHPLAKREKVSNKLLSSAFLPVEEIVMKRLGYKQGVTLEKGMMIGTGVQQPLGMFTLGNSTIGGIDSSRDVVGENTTSAIVADTLFDTKYSLKPQYQAQAKWLYHRDAIKQIAKLKDGYGQYLWQPGLSMEVPDRLLGLPVLQSEYVPNTFTTGQYVGMLGVYSFYWVARALDMQVQKLTELYAEKNQTEFIIRSEMDGAPVMAEAFARVKLA